MLYPPALLALAATQDHLLTRRQTVPGILTNGAWYRRIASGALIPVFPGVCRLPAPPMTEIATIRAAILSVGRGCLASHRSAALLWGMPVPHHDEVDLVVPNRWVQMKRKGVVIHEPTDMSDLRGTKRQGIPVVGAARTLVDLGAVCEPAVVANALEHVLVNRITTIGAVAKALDRHEGRGRNGAGVLRHVLTDTALGARPPDSVLEAKVLRLLKRHQLPPLVFQHEVTVGRKKYRIDFADPEQRKGFEFDGWTYHGTRLGFERDRRKIADLATVGYQIVPYTWRQVMRDESFVAESIRATLGLPTKP